MMFLLYHHDVRTTLTLDEDVVQRLREEMRKSGMGFKEAVNSFLRRGLNARPNARRLQPFRVRARPLVARAGLSYENIGDLLEQVEGPAHR
jgi:hypothetical protein